MAKADVLQLVADLTNSLANQTVASELYDDVVTEMGMKPNESMTGAGLIQVTAGTAQYSYPTTALRLLSLHYDTVALQPGDTNEAAVYDKQWRTTRGDPLTWVVERESRRTFTLVPVPQRTGATVGASTPFSATFPEGNVTAIYTETRTDVHPWEELYVAFIVTAQELARDSDHTDLQLSEALAKLAEGIKPILELE